MIQIQLQVDPRVYIYVIPAKERVKILAFRAKV